MPRGERLCRGRGAGPQLIGLQQCTFGFLFSFYQCERLYHVGKSISHFRNIWEWDREDLPVVEANAHFARLAIQIRWNAFSIRLDSCRWTCETPE
jgi:hypothetical protein